MLKPNFYLLFWAETALLVVEEDRSMTNPLPTEEAVSEREMSYAESKVSGSAYGLVGTQAFLRVRTILWPTEEHIGAVIIIWDNGVAYRKGIADIS